MPSAHDDLPRTRATAAFERRVARALAPHLEDGERVIVACSGGPDSTALLVATVRALGASRVIAAQFDHRLRADGARERETVEALARRLGVRTVFGRAPRRPPERSESAAREARYRWLARVCGEEGVTACITGHTLDDQAETVLLRLARGTGLRGAAAMDPSSSWPVAARGGASLRLVRPLLGITRAEVNAYLAALDVAALHDPSNDWVEYARNRIRHRVLPELRSINPRAAEQIAGFAGRARDAEQALDALADAWLDQHARVSRSAIAVDRRALLALPPGLAAHVVQQAAARLRVALDAAGVDGVLRAARRRGSRVALGDAYAATDAILLTLRRNPRIPGQA